MTYSIIKKSQLEGALRIDAEYFQPEYLANETNLKRYNALPLTNISCIAYGTTPSGGHFESFGVPFIRSQSFSTFIVDENNVEYCTKKFHTQNKKSAVKPKDILFAAVGATIGEVAIIQDEIHEGNINQNIARVRIKDKNFDSNFVGLFFGSKAGQIQIKRFTTGNAQPYLNSEQIGSFLVPKITKRNQLKIGKYFSKINKFSKIAIKYYQQAEDLLLEKLGLKDFEKKNDLFSIVKLSDAQKAKRIDAEYFQPKFYNLISKIKKNDYKKLSEVIEIVPANFNLKPEENYNYVELAKINSALGIIDGAENVLGKDAPSRAKRELKENDIIVSSVEGSLEKVALVNKEQDGYIASTGFFQFRSKAILPEVLLIIAKSVIFQYQLMQRCSGTILTAVSEKSINNMIVPILPKPFQIKIADLVTKSHRARQKSKSLLAEAKRKVEEMIEKK